MIDFGFLLIGFLNYTLHKSNCQAKLAELITLKVVEILLIICYDLTSIDSKYIIFMGPCMSSLAAQTIFTPGEYLALERKATVKSEYLNGEIRAMPRANFAHNLITVDIATELNIQSRVPGWDVCMSNMRVKTGAKGAYFYPDVVVFCGDPQFEDNVFDTLLNPILVVEVLSPSTEAYDKGEKFRHYQELASLQEYILVSQDRIRVEQYRLTKTQWVQTEFRAPEDVLPLVSIGCELPLQDIYRRVAFSD